MRILILLIIFITLPISAIAEGKITPKASRACWKMYKATYGTVYPNLAEFNRECNGPNDKPLYNNIRNLICCHNIQKPFAEIQMEIESEYSEETKYDSSEVAEPTQYDSSEGVEPTTSIEELEDKVNELEDTLNQLYMNNQ